eukprot:Nitzschia sp. Nitz4//scaffold68_size99682//61545//61841//NITZ4_004571-RA/size99682-processed-gene-0.78-mRNA-1//1//CDS//3329556614//751//frame0
MISAISSSSSNCSQATLPLVSSNSLLESTLLHLTTQAGDEEQSQLSRNASTGGDFEEILAIIDEALAVVNDISPTTHSDGSSMGQDNDDISSLLSYDQ